MSMSFDYDQYTILDRAQAIGEEEPCMFIDSQSKVDREGLRTFVGSELTRMKQVSTKLTQEKSGYWQKVKTAIKLKLSPHEQPLASDVIDQLIGLPQYIEMWIKTSVESPERFEFFVLAKANELKSGDEPHDYYWALQIRHDQLVALVRVLEILLDKMAIWVSQRPDQLFDDPVFSGLTEYGLEEQVYLEAEKVYQERQQITGTKE